MAEAGTWREFLGGARIDEAVFTLRPHHRVLLLAVDGLTPAPTDGHSEALLCRAEEAAAGPLADAPVDELPHVAAWREVYRAFGAKPQRARDSLEVLTRRASLGPPRVNRLTDVATRDIGEPGRSCNAAPLARRSLGSGRPENGTLECQPAGERKMPCTRPRSIRCTTRPRSGRWSRPRAPRGW